MSNISLEKALKYGEKELFKKNIDSARLDAELLLAHILGLTQEKLLANPKYPVSSAQYPRFRRLINKRKQGYSAAVLIGHKEFYGIDFHVNKDVLIPRPETELIIESVLDYCKNDSGRRGDPAWSPENGRAHGPSPTKNRPNILEVGTGSGCIALTLAKHLPGANIIALDVSNKALKIAKRNKRSLKIKNVKFKRSNLLSEFKNEKYRRWVVPPDIIVANLPYLTSEELKEPSISKEPKKALYGGKNGLELYEELLGEIKTMLARRGDPTWSPEKGRAHGPSPTRPAMILFEINPSQSKKITKIVKDIFPKAETEIKKDLAGRDRVLVIKI